MTWSGPSSETSNWVTVTPSVILPSGPALGRAGSVRGTEHSPSLSVGTFSGKAAPGVVGTDVVVDDDDDADDPSELDFPQPPMTSRAARPRAMRRIRVSMPASQGRSRTMGPRA